MLKTLHLENFALFKKADFEPKGRFCAITGETGAGKTLLLEAIKLLAGGRTAPQFIRHGEDTCRLSAVFSPLSKKQIDSLKELSLLDDEEEEAELWINRTITADGKTKILINGRPATLTILRQVMADLLEIQSRGDTESLCKEENHIEYLTRFASGEQALEEYKSAYAAYRSASASYKSCKENLREAKEKQELFKMQLDDLKSAQLKAGEEEKLTKRRDVLKNAAKLSSTLTRALQAFGCGEKSGAVDFAFEAKDALDTLSELIPDIANVSARVGDIAYELESLRDDVKKLAGDVGENAEDELNRIEERLFTLRQIARRYGGTVESAMEKQAYLEKQLSLLDDGEASAETLKQVRLAAYKEAVKKGEILSSIRKEGARKLTDALHEELAALDLENMRFSVSITPAVILSPDKDGTGQKTLLNLKPDGIDNVSFRIIANRGESEKSLAETASAGEAARLMLALRTLLALSFDRDLLILDEIDSGVSGKTAKKIGETLKKLSATVSVLSITHSAQVASSADDHQTVKKDITPDGRTESRICPLAGEERVLELARILGGITVTQASLDNARALLYN